MIAKRINYCWFGQMPLPESAKKCIESWKKYCPDYEIVEWNESNFDVNYNEYTKYCYDNKRWAFLSDYVRLVIIYQNGGIYFDTDVEVIRSLDPLLESEAFFGFENSDNVATGLGFGAVKGHKALEAMMQEYHCLEPDSAGNFPMVVCPALNTAALKQFGLELNGKLQDLNGIMIYPVDYFNPMNSLTGEIKVTEHTYTIHRYAMSWLSKKQRIKSKITRVFHRIFGVHCFEWLKKKTL